MRSACWITKGTNTHSQYVLILFFHYNGCTNAPQYYVIRTLHVLLTLTHCGPVTQICVFTLQLRKTDEANMRF